jgi:4'-phosphopantetheinyl transferase
MLPDDALHLWHIHLDAQGSDEALSSDERERAARLKIPQVRARFIAGRAALRDILSQYVRLPPDRLQFEYGQEGKPALINTPLHFNLAHSEDHALLAVANHPVGVDFERIRPLTKAEQTYIANSAFIPNERDWLFGLPPEEQQTAFFRLWTCKEAVMKAHGGGFRLAQQIEIGFRDDGAPHLNQFIDKNVNYCLISQITDIAGFIDAVAVETERVQVVLRNYNYPN